MLNNVTVMGRLCADPELKHTQSDVPVTFFRIAVERNDANQDGERETDFFDVTAWRTTAEIICDYFSKGRMIAIDGRLETQRWKDRDGNNRVTVAIVAENIYFADSKRDNDEDEDDGRGRKSNNRKPAAKGRKNSRSARDEEYEDEYYDEEDSFDEDGGGYDEPPRRGNSNGRRNGGSNNRGSRGSRRAA